MAGVNFAGSILVFYYTDFFRFSLETHVGHEFMNVHFLLTGFLFALVMIARIRCRAGPRTPCGSCC